MDSEKTLDIMTKFFMDKLGCAEGMARFMAEQLLAELENAGALR